MYSTEVPRHIAKTNPNIFREGTFQIEEVLPYFECKEKANFHGSTMNFNSKRYKVFLYKGTNCVKCGLEGRYFAKERFETDLSYHFNLYGIDNMGDEVLFTRDHILPRAYGGKDNVDNQVPMCIVCNNTKGIYVSKEEIAYLKNDNGVNNDAELIGLLEAISLTNPNNYELHVKMFKDYVEKRKKRLKNFSGCSLFINTIFTQ